MNLNLGSVFFFFLLKFGGVFYFLLLKYWNSVLSKQKNEPNLGGVFQKMNLIWVVFFFFFYPNSVVFLLFLGSCKPFLLPNFGAFFFNHYQFRCFFFSTTTQFLGFIFFFQYSFWKEPTQIPVVKFISHYPSCFCVFFFRRGPHSNCTGIFFFFLYRRAALRLEVKISQAPASQPGRPSRQAAWSHRAGQPATGGAGSKGGWLY